MVTTATASPQARLPPIEYTLSLSGCYSFALVSRSVVPCFPVQSWLELLRFYTQEVPSLLLASFPWLRRNFTSATPAAFCYTSCASLCLKSQNVSPSFLGWPPRLWRLALLLASMGVDFQHKFRLLAHLLQMANGVYLFRWSRVREGNFNFNFQLGSENRLALDLGRLLFYLRRPLSARPV